MIEIKGYLDRLLKIFDQLSDHIAYLKVDSHKNTVKYIQQLKTGTTIVTVSNIYFDFTHSGFIKYSTIIKNKEILSKLLNYENSLILLNKYKYGYEVRVYNISGELIYHQYIKFYDKTKWYQKLYLSKKYPELILSE